MNSLIRLTSQLIISPSMVSTRYVSTTPTLNSVFMKRQKKIDPEVAKQREARRRKRLEKEIRQMQKHSKKPKPVDELTLDIKSAKNIHERQREPTILTEDQIDERAISMKDYTRSRNAMQKIDDAWVRQALYKQDKALKELKALDKELYQKAIELPAGSLPVVLRGPTITPPIAEYESPDGDYVDTTRTWV